MNLNEPQHFVHFQSQHYQYCVLDLHKPMYYRSTICYLKRVKHKQAQQFCNYLLKLISKSQLAYSIYKECVYQFLLIILEYNFPKLIMIYLFCFLRFVFGFYLQMLFKSQLNLLNSIYLYKSIILNSELFIQFILLQLIIHGTLKTLNLNQQIIWIYQQLQLSVKQPIKVRNLQVLQQPQLLVLLLLDLLLFKEIYLYLSYSYLLILIYL